jgi:hypothetical protein
VAHFRRDYCGTCHWLTCQKRVDGGGWCCLACGHVETEGALVFVVISAPTPSRDEDVWVEAVFSTLGGAVGFIRSQEQPSLFWIEPFGLDGAIGS